MADERRRQRRSGPQSSPRTAAVWSTVHALAASREQELGRPLQVLDLGGGTGGLAVSLAGCGHHVTVVDPSPDALASLRRRAAESGADRGVTAVQGDADNLAQIFDGALLDLACCHGTLEVVDDPQASVERIAAVLAPGGYLSLVAAQRLAVVLARALAGQFQLAQRALLSDDGRWGEADPLPRRFDVAGLVRLVEQTGLTVQDTHGVRIFTDLVPSALLDSDADRVALFELEHAAATHPQFDALSQLGAALHLVATRGT